MNLENENLTPQKPEDENTAAQSEQPLSTGAAEPPEESGQPAPAAEGAGDGDAPQAAEASGEPPAEPQAQDSSSIDSLMDEYASAGGPAPAPDSPEYTNAQDDHAQDTPQGQEEPPSQPAVQTGELAPVYVAPQPSEPQKPGGKGKIIAIAAAAAVALVAIILIVMVFQPGSSTTGRKPNKEKDPEGYLEFALAQTNNRIAESSVGYPELGRFAGKPMGVDFEASLDASQMPYGFDMGINGSLKSNPELEQYLLEVDLSAPFVRYRDNKLYITPDVVAVSVPDVIRKAEYITINPKTLEEDLQNSEYGEYMDMPPTLTNPEGILESAERLEARMLEHWAAFQENAEFEYEGAESQGSGSGAVDIMSYTYPASSVQRLYDNMLEAFGDYMLDYMTLYMTASYSYYSPEEMVEMMMDEMRAVEFNQRAVIRYSINQDAEIVRIEFAPYTVEVFDDYWQEYETATIGMIIELGDGADPLDQARITLDITDEDGDTGSIVLSNQRSFDNGTLVHKMTMSVIDPWDSRMDFGYDFEWTPANTGDRNLRASFTAKDDYWTDVEVRLTGILEDTDSELSLKDGSLVFYDEDDVEVAFKLAFRAYLLEGEDADFSLDLSDAVFFFDLTSDELYQLLF